MVGLVSVFGPASAASAAVLNVPGAVAIPLAAAKPHPLAPGAHTFRLGTGAGLFGWSTAVVDFNRDGGPDLAVIDKAGRTSRGYQYRIEFIGDP